MKGNIKKDRKIILKPRHCYFKQNLAGSKIIHAAHHHLTSPKIITHQDNHEQQTWNDNLKTSNTRENTPKSFKKMLHDFMLLTSHACKRGKKLLGLREERERFQWNSGRGNVVNAEASLDRRFLSLEFAWKRR